ncbi:MAG: PQQ-dependent catabolism-associated CXXCW motif protein [Candidatus Thiodiazotropha sp.]
MAAYSSQAADETTLFSFDGYRIDQFRAPVPDSVPSGTTLDTAQLQTLLEERDLLLIDVMPAPIKPKDRPDTLLWLPPSRDNIPGSHWLPNVGYGALSDELERYFKGNLERLSKGNKNREIVLYCLADCWMSWNAAKRAATEYGYTAVYWYPDGTTGWEAAGLPLDKSEPLPMQTNN